MATSIRETQTTYDPPAGMPMPPRIDGLPEVASTVEPGHDELEAEYFDTEDLRLIRAGITLCRQRGSGDPGRAGSGQAGSGWRLNLAAGPHTRCEIGLPLTSETGQVPAELARLVRACSREQMLRPVAQMTVQRRRVVLRDSSGKSLAELAADDVRARAMGETMKLTRWQEVDVGLTGGDRSLLAAADTMLRREGLSPAGHRPKLARALGLEHTGPGSPGLSPSDPAGEVVQACLREQVQMLLALDPQVRRDEPDSVHRMRITTRRLRSALQTFGDVIAQPQTPAVAGELKWLAGVLGDARDTEVLAARLLDCLTAMPAEQVIGPVRARVRRHFAPRSATARDSVLQALDSPRYFALLGELDTLATVPLSGPAAQQGAGQVLPGAVRHACDRAARRMEAALVAADPAPAGAGQPEANTADAALHAARRAAKRARYVAEAVAPAFGDDAAALARQMRKLQSVLGHHQDTVISRQTVREMAIRAHMSGENAFTYGLLHERDACEAEKLRAQAARIWKKASRGRYQHWMS